MHCNVAKVRRGTNAVRSKLQGRRNVTAQQLLSLFFAFYCIYIITMIHLLKEQTFLKGHLLVAKITKITKMT